MSDRRRTPTIMVSSTVYGIEELLERVYTLLIAFGYEVWMSHKGTLPGCSDRTAFGTVSPPSMAVISFSGSSPEITAADGTVTSCPLPIKRSAVL